MKLSIYTKKVFGVTVKDWALLLLVFLIGLVIVKRSGEEPTQKPPVQKVAFLCACTWNRTMDLCLIRTAFYH